MEKHEKLQKILDYLDEKGIHVEYYPGVAEMGYDDKVMIAGDWNIGAPWVKKNGRDLNQLNMERIGDYLEKECGVEIEWSDEWTNCSHCYKAVRTSPNCYGWEASYVWVSDGEILCHECVENNQEWLDEIIEWYANDHRKVVLSWFYKYLEQEEFICYSPDEYCQIFETGLHPGQNDDPEKIAQDIEENLPEYDYIFKIDGVGQFDVSWSVFLRKQKTDEENE